MRTFKRNLILFFALAAFTPAFAQKKLSPKKDKVVTITTPQGDIKLIAFDETPLHKANFLKLAEEGFYNNTTFHRVIDNFMIQGGDPNSKNESPNDDGAGSNGYSIPAEFVAGITHVKGALAAARTENPKKESSGCQFYIVQNEMGTHFLDGNYTVFGQTIAGFDVIDAIAKTPKDFRDRPLTDVKMAVNVETMKKKDITKKYGYAYPLSEKEAKKLAAKEAKKVKVKDDKVKVESKG